jgi:hypothetical protein
LRPAPLFSSPSSPSLILSTLPLPPVFLGGFTSRLPLLALPLTGHQPTCNTLLLTHYHTHRTERDCPAVLDFAITDLQTVLLKTNKPDTSTTITMFDSWALQYCVACEKQVQADNDLYCSESCRLADFETTSSTTSSQSGSPGFTPTSSWNTAPSRPSHTKFYLSPAYDFSNAQPYGSSAAPTSYMDNYSRSSPSKAEQTRTSLPTSTLSPSSSHSSLCSMQSNNSSTDSINLSDKARKELRAYAVSFEQVRLQRRRSY